MIDTKNTLLRAVIFDMDGVLIDSEPFWREAEIEIFARVGVSLTEADCLLTVGMRIQEVAAFWHARRPWKGPPPEALAIEILAGVIERVRTRGAPMPGLDGALRFIRDRGLALALATSSAAPLINAVLDRLDLRDVFSVVCSAEDEPRGKPHPGVYLTAAGRLGVPPAFCVAIEDSIHGVIAAKAAGMRCIAIPLPELRGEPGFSEADVVLKSLVEIDEDLLSRLAKPSKVMPGGRNVGN
jgi:HAD superfamily hydrolase (TIGR01509 family)